MAEKNVSLTALDGSPIDSAELSADFREAEEAGPFRVGRTAFYYREGLKRRVVPLAAVDQAFTQVEPVITHVDTGPLNIKIYRLIICSKGIQLASIRTEDEAQIKEALVLLKDRLPNLEIGCRTPE